MAQSERATANITRSQTEDAEVRIFIETLFPPVFSSRLYYTLDPFLRKGSHLFQQGSRLFQDFFFGLLVLGCRLQSKSDTKPIR